VLEAAAPGRFLIGLPQPPTTGSTVSPALSLPSTSQVLRFDSDPLSAAPAVDVRSPTSLMGDDSGAVYVFNSSMPVVLL
jgi:hypothetical protein